MKPTREMIAKFERDRRHATDAARHEIATGLNRAIISRWFRDFENARAWVNVKRPRIGIFPAQDSFGILISNQITK